MKLKFNKKMIAITLILILIFIIGVFVFINFSQEKIPIINNNKEISISSDKKYPETFIIYQDGDGNLCAKEFYDNGNCDGVQAAYYLNNAQDVEIYDIYQNSYVLFKANSNIYIANINKMTIIPLTITNTEEEYLLNIDTNENILGIAYYSYDKAFYYYDYQTKLASKIADNVYGISILSPKYISYYTLEKGESIYDLNSNEIKMSSNRCGFDESLELLDPNSEFVASVCPCHGLECFTNKTIYNIKGQEIVSEVPDLKLDYYQNKLYAIKGNKIEIYNHQGKKEQSLKLPAVPNPIFVKNDYIIGTNNNYLVIGKPQDLNFIYEVAKLPETYSGLETVKYIDDQLIITVAYDKKIVRDDYPLYRYLEYKIDVEKQTYTVKNIYEDLYEQENTEYLPAIIYD